MNQVEGYIIDVIQRKTYKGKVFFDTKIRKIVETNDVSSDMYIMPGFIDAHVHIESTMLSPIEYAKVALRHGVVGAVTDPHEIANVCGIEGVRFMVEQAKQCPMKIFTAAPSCVPATDFETSGSELGEKEISYLFQNNLCSHLGEMMNFPGVLNHEKTLMAKIELAKQYAKPIDGHAPQLGGKELRKYIKAGMSSDHECSTIQEALEKISLGMKIMLRDASGSKDFDRLITLIKTHHEHLMLCTDDKHPDLFLKEYIDNQVKKALKQDYSIYDVINVANTNANDHYKMNIGLLQKGDSADFIVVDNLSDFTIRQTYINGDLHWAHNATQKKITNTTNFPNKFYINHVSEEDLQVKNTSDAIRVIELVKDSLLTKEFYYKTSGSGEYLNSIVADDILKIVVLNRYNKAKPQTAFVKGFGLKQGAIAGSVAHDSHNIIAVGVSDRDILKAIKLVQKLKGALVAVNDEQEHVLSLEIAGLMSSRGIDYVAAKYLLLDQSAKEWGSRLTAPFMTLSFLALLVIPDLKIGDKGLFDVNRFEFVTLQLNNE